MKRINIYTDGSCIKNPGGPGGWGFYITFCDKDDKILSDIPLTAENKNIFTGRDPKTTNNKMELTAVIKALEYVKKNQANLMFKNSIITIYSDSNYFVRGYNEWMENWYKKNRLNDNMTSTVANPDLWLKILKFKNYFKDQEVDILTSKQNISQQNLINKNEVLICEAESKNHESKLDNYKIVTIKSNQFNISRNENKSLFNLIDSNLSNLNNNLSVINEYMIINQEYSEKIKNQIIKLKQLPQEDSNLNKNLIILQYDIKNLKLKLFEFNDKLTLIDQEVEAHKKAYENQNERKIDATKISDTLKLQNSPYEKDQSNQNQNTKLSLSAEVNNLNNSNLNNSKRGKNKRSRNKNKNKNRQDSIKSVNNIKLEVKWIKAHQESEKAKNEIMANYINGNNEADRRATLGIKRS